MRSDISALPVSVSSGMAALFQPGDGVADGVGLGVR
jgi:hypothetical protein